MCHSPCGSPSIDGILARVGYPASWPRRKCSRALWSCVAIPILRPHKSNLIHRLSAVGCVISRRARTFGYPSPIGKEVHLLETCRKSLPLSRAWRHHLESGRFLAPVPRTHALHRTPLRAIEQRLTRQRAEPVYSKTLPEVATMTSTRPCNSIFAGVRLREVVVDPVCNAPGAPQSYGLARSPPYSGAQHPFTDRPPNRPKNGFRTASWLLIGSGAPWIPVFAK